MGNDKTDHNREEEKTADNERPPVDLHDPFNRFEFEPTDGGDF